MCRANRVGLAVNAFSTREAVSASAARSTSVLRGAVEHALRLPASSRITTFGSTPFRGRIGAYDHRPWREFTSPGTGKLTGGEIARIVRRARENPAQHRFEGGEVLGRIVGIEGALIPGRAEVHAGLVPRMMAPALASVAIAAEVMHVIVILEQTVLRHDPGHFRAHVGTQYGRRHFGVIVGRKLIADVVNQRRHDHFLVGAVLHGAGGGLKTMPQPADGIACKGVIELTQVLEHAPAQADGILSLGLIEQEVVLPGAVLHAPEADDPTHALRLTSDDSARRRRSTRYRLRGPSISM